MKLSFKFKPKLTELQLNIIEELSFHTTKLYNIVNYDCRENGFNGESARILPSSIGGR